ncbi:MAG: hypothetical protein HQK49_05240 [Oligoflexia bacterium]|nr:hypothetical protein [Oligoflexia bacterium]
MILDDKLKKLTEELYSEGLQKGQKEAETLILEAKKEFEKILKKANEEARTILSNAHKESAEIKRKAEMEIQLSSKQMVSKIKKDISALITFRTLNHSLKDSFNKTEFIEELVLSTIRAWKKDSAGAFDLSIHIHSKYENKIKPFLEKCCKDEMEKGLNIIISENIKDGIRIAPKDGSYSIDLSEESFNALLMDYLKPATKELLFS